MNYKNNELNYLNISSDNKNLINGVLIYLYSL